LFPPQELVPICLDPLFHQILFFVLLFLSALPDISFLVNITMLKK
jgi:hypothetical protein